MEDQDVIKKILKHLALWDVKPRPQRADAYPLSPSSFNLIPKLANLKQYYIIT